MVPDSVELFIMKKKKPTHDAKKQRIKSGIHIVVPGVCTHKYIEQSVRRTLLPQMDQIFPGLPLNEPWEKVYDEQVLNRSQPWTMYGSRKNDPNALPYLISYVLSWTREGIQVVPNHPKDCSTGLLKTLSLRRDPSEETPMTEETVKKYDKIRNARGGGDANTTTAEQKRRGRPPQRVEQVGSRGSSPNGRIAQPLSGEKKEYLKAHVMNLNDVRFEDYDKWVYIGICLFNIHPELLDVFLDFSSQSEKYSESDCIQKWNSFSYRNDGERTGEPTLRFLSREDDREGYDNIEKNNVDRLVMAACSGTEHDVASVIHAKFRDYYKCSDFRNNIWYRWMGHIWQRTDQGVDLQLKLSKEIAKVFENKAGDIKRDMDVRGLTDCSSGGKDDCKTCDYCQMESQKMSLLKMYTQLKKTSFKTNVMRECRELFFDELFARKLDTNKDVIAFNNGVLDMITFEFRPGKQEDCMSFSTGNDYDPGRPYYDYPEWQRVDTFIRQVLPKKTVRDYFMKHLASNLFGGNPAQKFHILTGSGSNGKSMIMNLMTKALGDYACTVPISLLTQKRKGSGSAAPEVARLKGRRFVTMQEPDEQIALNTGLMKEISSGEKMYARDLFESGGEFEVLAKFHLACNEKPKINTTDGGTWRRLVVINFLSKFVMNPVGDNEYPMDESIQFSVNSTDWATPFLSYLVHVLKEGQGLRKLSAPDDVLEYTNDYRNENDAIAKFIGQMVVPYVDGDEVVQVVRQTLKDVFKRWKGDDLRNLSPAELEKRIVAMYGPYPKGGWTKFKLVDA
jgi:P4 family phage/plasmid primase-like protien